jgi:uncharacterized protein (DUF58 family)
LACSAALVASAFLRERYGVYIVASVSLWFLVSASIESWRFLDPMRAEAEVSENPAREITEPAV